MGVVISIHALREEGDDSSIVDAKAVSEFLSTPSARRATAVIRNSDRVYAISIHALREEGDLCAAHVAMQAKLISIHALREEGDSKNRDKISIFKQIIQHSARI